MVVEDAHRFGLAQLHQLRGRIGRGDRQGYCFLLGVPPTGEGKRRIRAMCSTTDGFALAEEDLRLRGPGEVCGIRQHGLTDFRVADLVRDAGLLQLAREEAEALVESGLQDYPDFRSRMAWFVGERLGLAVTG